MASTLSTVNVNLNANDAEYIAALKRIQTETERRLKRTESNWVKFGKSVSTVGGAVGQLTAAAGVATGVMVAMTQQALTNARDLERLSEAAGLSVDEFSDMSLAVQTVGVNADQLGSILGDTEEKIGDFIATGGGAFQDFVDVMNLSEEQAKATAKELQKLSGRDVLVEMVRQMEAAGKSSEEMNFALEGMASDARYLLPLLRDNARELGNLENQFGGVATTIDQQTVKELQELDTIAGIVAGNMQNTLAVAVAGASDWLKTAGLNAAFFFASLQEGTEQNYIKTIEDTKAEIEAINTEIKYLQNRGYSNIFQDDAETVKKLEDRVLQLNTILITTEAKLNALRNGGSGGAPDPEPRQPNGGSGGSGSSSSGGSTFGELYGGTNTVDLNALNDYKALEALKTQYLDDALALRQQLYIDDAESYEDRLNRQMEVELSQLDERLKGTEAYEQKKAAIEAKYRNQKELLDKASADSELQRQLGATDSVLSALGFEFSIRKQYATAKALLDEQTGLAAAWAKPFPENIAEAALLLAEHGVIQSAIKAINFAGQAHDGLENVPREGTYLLDQGEAVLKRDQNRELTEFLQKQKKGEGMGTTNVTLQNTFNNGGEDFGKMVMREITKQPKMVASVVEKGKSYRPARRNTRS